MSNHGSPTERMTRHSLTPRELMVLALLSEGLAAKAIAHRLRVSSRTVHKHQENLYRKLGTSDRLGTVLLAQRLGLVSTPEMKRYASTHNDVC